MSFLNLWFYQTYVHLLHLVRGNYSGLVWITEENNIFTGKQSTAKNVLPGLEYFVLISSK